MNKSKDKLNNIRILIIGSGIIGKFNALELSKFGFDITIVDDNEINNSSNAALGIIMNKIYQKRKGRSWILRQKSFKLWPKWIKLLKKYNSKLNLERPLFQLTTDYKKFEKLINFADNYPQDDFEIVHKNSVLLTPVNKLFKGNQLKGLISHQDGRVDPKILMETLNTYIKKQKIKTINDHVLQIKRLNKCWSTKLKSGKDLLNEIVILCNSLESIKLINPEIYGIKLKPVLGQAIEITSKENTIDFLSLPKILNINGKNLIPISKDKIIIGSTDEYDCKTNENRIDDLINFLEETPYWLNKNKISRKWFGIRSKPEGEPSPIMKSLDNGLILCSGFYKNGILLAPACSNWISEEIKKHI
tara:strand:+ start:54 stop:1133 length:1080 start_codon:yes stop_codon:yes gene_type:complete